MASNFQLNQAGLDRAVKAAVKAQAKETQALLDKLLRTYKGKPVPEVKTALLREWRQSGGKMTDAEATEWATALNEGRRIVLKT